MSLSQQPLENVTRQALSCQRLFKGAESAHVGVTTALSVQGSNQQLSAVVVPLASASWSGSAAGRMDACFDHPAPLQYPQLLNLIEQHA